MSTTETIQASGRNVKISRADKVLFPDAGLTKLDLARYYAEIAETMLPHARGRVVSMERRPDGLDGGRFYQKKLPGHFPDWIRSVRVNLRDGGSQQQVVVADAATLVYLADQACITPHVWLSRWDRLDHPDRLIFDLDPADDDFSAVRRAARRVRDALAEVNLPAYVMTTGSRGLHVAVPLDGESDFDTVRAFAGDLADLLARRHDDELTVEQRKNKRKGRLLLDVARNAYGQTAVPPYAVRARPSAPVAVPLDWEELSRGDLGPRSYTIRNVSRRLAQTEDPWADMARHAHGLGPARERLNRLRDGA